MQCTDENTEDKDRTRGGWGTAEATEMVTNNLFYITVKFGDEHPKEVEELWAAICACWPKNLRIIIRYLLIVTGLAPCELVDYSKRVLLYLGRAQPVKTLEEMMMELQTVETFNCNIERTETPPYYRLTSLRKTSSNSDEKVHLTSSRQDLSSMSGTIHTKRHSQEEHNKEKEVKSEKSDMMGSMKSMASSVMAASIQRVGEKVRALSGSTVLKQDLHTVLNVPTTDDHIVNQQKEQKEPIQENMKASQGSGKAFYHPHPLPMPEYGGWFAPLTEFLPEATQPISTFHRCNLAAILLTDLVVDGLDLDCHSVDWSVHIPLMLHIIFLGLDNSREMVFKHCRQLLLNLLIVMGHHNDHLGISRIMMNAKIDLMNHGLSLPNLPVIKHNFTNKKLKEDSEENLEEENQRDSASSVSEDDESQLINRAPIDIRKFEEDNIETATVEEVIKAMINFISAKNSQPFWQYEDITKSVWSIKSVEQIDIFVQHILRVFEMSLPPNAHLAERWSQLSLQLALSCSSRHYAGRSLQIFRALRVPITSRMLSDILSRLVETIAEQGDDMQGYVTELFLTLEAVVDSIDSDFRPMNKDIFKSTPNLKEVQKMSPRQEQMPMESSNVVSPVPGHVYHASAPPMNPLSRYGVKVLTDSESKTSPKECKNV